MLRCSTLCLGLFIVLVAVSEFATGKRLKLVTCLQSSIIAGGVCSRAIDGNTNQQWNRGSCSHTNSERGWWQARTTVLARIKRVRIYNRLDCCPNRLSDIVIKVDGHECASYQSSSGYFTVRDFNCDKVGQVVSVHNRKVSPLSMCEVQVFGEEFKLPALGNRLKLAACFQSTTVAGGVCNRAIDGNTNPDYSSKSCTHTAQAKGAWWQAVLERRSHIKHVRIFNRLDCCSSRLNDFIVTIDGHECASYRSNAFFSVGTFKCDKTGRLLRIQTRKNSHVSLCEVKVYGESVKRRRKLARRLPLTACLQSSIVERGVCARAIDGNTNQHWDAHSCSHTNSEKGWWHASTKAFARIQCVRIYNRLDCCSMRLRHFTILVDGHPCATYKSNKFFAIKTFRCGGIGQVVTVRNEVSSPLSLCEVQVFGDYVPTRPTGKQLTLVGCSQSSTIVGGVCSRAIDGNTNQDWHGKSCTHTTAQKGWWQARTTKLAHIKHVRIFNRLDCCSDRLNDFIVMVDGHECASYRSALSKFFSTKTFLCRRTGRVVSIQNRQVSPLSLCEVQVFGTEVRLANVGKQLKLTSCWQSSLAAGGVCDRAIDGNARQSWHRRSCSHTSNEKGWWQASAKKLARITHIRIYNRLDCCSERLNDFAISVDGHECASYRSKGFFSVKTFVCNKVGQMVTIRNRKVSPLSLCEVQIFGKYVKRLTSAKRLQLVTCLQSSTAAGGVCNRAIDGNTNQHWDGKSCTHTTAEKGWWQARTKKLARIKYVRIFNRLDCCSDRLSHFAVLVDGHECASYQSGGYFSTRLFSCDRIGQVVSIVNRKVSSLSLCEVQVFGEEVKLPALGNQLTLVRCSQSSIVAEGSCRRAIDGNPQPDWNHKSCSHTNNEKGWWQASTKNLARIEHIRIFNRLDCCSDRLNNFVVLVDGHECASYRSGGFFSVRTFVCNKVGQIVTVRNRKVSPLSLCEVQVFGKYIKLPSRAKLLKLVTCLQSSTTAGGICNRAIDGNANQHWDGKSCTHTTAEKGWWQARTKKLAHIRQVRLFNRLDCCSDRLNNFIVMIDGHQCASYQTPGFFTILTFHCDMVGQVVRVQNRKVSPLSLCEVQVFGTEVRQQQLGKPIPMARNSCSQSSIVEGGVCKRAIDGNTNPDWTGRSCTHTRSESSWWQASFKRRSRVKHVRIFNRLDCCSDRLSDFSVSIDGHECASYRSSGFFSVKTFKCNRVGKTIRIQNRKRSHLSLCEVQVFGRRFRRRPKFSYLGCFVDDKEWRDFPVKALSASSGRMTPAKCHSACQRRGATFFALQGGSECWCGDNYGSNGSADRAKCNTPCSGDRGATCGGVMHNAVYAVKIGKPPKELVRA